MSFIKLIEADFIVTVDPNDRVLKAHTLAIQDGKIQGLVPHDAARKKYPNADLISLPGQVLMPGFVNAHTHAAMSLFRGLADDLPLFRWLEEVIWPCERLFANETFVSDGAELAIAEMLLSGTTCFNDMYRLPEATAQAADKTGIRAVMGLRVNNFRTGWGEDPDLYFDQALNLADRYCNHPLISTAFAPHAPYTLNDEPLERMRFHANRLDLRIHLHLHESKWEIDHSIKTFSQRPLARLRELGLLSEKLLAVHAVHLSQSEIEDLETHRVNIAHCPRSNLKLGNGVCPVPVLLDHDVNVALGTDSAASNNSLDMLAELRTATLLTTLSDGKSSPISVHTALRMATAGGAKALGLGDKTGSLEPGKAADVIAVDLNTVTNQPYYNPVSALVYSAGRGDITHVWVAGQLLVNSGKLVRQDINNLVDKCQYWRNKIEQHRESLTQH